MGLNLLIDGTIRTSEDEEALVKALKPRGYRTEVHHMYLSRKDAAIRGVRRALGPTGRYVPVDVLLKNTTNERSFATLARMADKWSLYRNNVPRGTKPIKVSSG